MNANQSTTMYESVPVVSELNKVTGFDPLKFIRRTNKGEKKARFEIQKALVSSEISQRQDQTVSAQNHRPAGNY